MIVAGIGSRKGVSREEVLAAVETALAAHGLARTALSALATTAFKKDEAAIFAAGEELGLPVIVVDTATGARLSSPPGTGGEVSRATSARDGEGGVVAHKPPLRFASLTASPPLRGGEERRSSSLATLTRSALSQAVAGTPSVSESAALAAAGPGGRLLGPRIAVGRVTCAIAVGEARP